MALPNRLRPSRAVVVGALVGAVAVFPGAVAAADDTRPGSVAASGRGLALSAALDGDGVFKGAAGLSGSVDLAAWTLVSDLAAGEAPRFARAGRSPRSAAVGAWAAVGPNGNTSALNHNVLALTATSRKLYLGGDFYNTVGATDADSLAVWNGTAWSAVGGNDEFGGNAVQAIAVDGSDIYVGGTFTNADGIAAADHIVKWDGGSSSWNALGPGLNEEVRAIAISGNDVYVGGDFTEADGIAAADYVARWNGSWHALGDHNGNGVLADKVYALAISGNDVYVGGLFTEADGDPTADYIAKWNGSSWSNLGSNPAGTNGALSDTVYALRFSGRSLYVGGNFSNVAGIATADFVARWRGGAWSGLGSNGAGNGALGSRVYALVMAGTDLYVGGQFFNAAGIAEADGVARWDGSSWSALGSNGSGNGALNNTVQALAVFKGELYVGGLFTDAAGIPAADYAASWGLTPVKLPDGRVRAGTSGSYTGDDIYNTNADHQTVNRSAAPGATITYQVSIQNDSPTSNDRFTVAASGAASSDYTVKYFKGSTNITADVVAGTYRTTSLAPGATYVIKVQIKVKNSAPANSQVARKLTLTSVGDPTKRDAVKVVGKRS